MIQHSRLAYFVGAVLLSSTSAHAQQATQQDTPTTTIQSQSQVGDIVATAQHDV